MTTTLQASCSLLFMGREHPSKKKKKQPKKTTHTNENLCFYYVMDLLKPVIKKRI